MRINIKFKIIFLLSSIAFFACTSNINNKTTQKSINDIFNAKYKEYKAYFPSKFINHFPSNYNALSLRYSCSFSKDLGPITLYLANKDSITDSLLLSFKKASIASYSSNDSCLLIVNKFSNPEKFIDIKLSNPEKYQIERNCYLNKYPIPNFYEFDFNIENKDIWQFDKGEKLSECKLPEDYKIFVFEVIKGKFLNDSLLSEETTMPKLWKHGLSRGVAINNKNNLIIYWINIW